MIEIAIICLLLFMCLGVPVAFAIGFSGVLALAFGSDIPLFTAVQMTVKGINSWSLMACPLFILAGGIMGEAKLSDRIVSFAGELVSWMRGGIGCVCVIANMIFAALTQARMLYILLHAFLMIGRIYIIWLSCILYLYLLCICQTKRQFVSMYL